MWQTVSALWQESGECSSPQACRSHVLTHWPLLSAFHIGNSSQFPTCVNLTFPNFAAFQGGLQQLHIWQWRGKAASVDFGHWCLWHCVWPCHVRIPHHCGEWCRVAASMIASFQACHCVSATSVLKPTPCIFFVCRPWVSTLS